MTHFTQSLSLKQSDPDFGPVCPEESPEELRAHPDRHSLLPGGTLPWWLGDKGPRDARPRPHAPYKLKYLASAPNYGKTGLSLTPSLIQGPSGVYRRHHSKPPGSFNIGRLHWPSEASVHPAGWPQTRGTALAGRRRGDHWSSSRGRLSAAAATWPWGGAAGSSPEEGFAQFGRGHAGQDARSCSSPGPSLAALSRMQPAGPPATASHLTLLEAHGTGPLACPQRSERLAQ